MKPIPPTSNFRRETPAPKAVAIAVPLPPNVSFASQELLEEGFEIVAKTFGPGHIRSRLGGQRFRIFPRALS